MSGAIQIAVGVCPASHVAASGRPDTEAGLPLHASDVLRRFRRALAAADLPPVRLHDLRHGVGHYLMAQGANPHVVMQMLGHSTVTLTLNTYSRATVALVREAADAMQAAIGAAEVGAAR